MPGHGGGAATAPGRQRRSSVATAAYGNSPGSTRLRIFPGNWRVDPARSYATFSARVAGGPVRGRRTWRDGCALPSRSRTPKRA